MGPVANIALCIVWLIRLIYNKVSNSIHPPIVMAVFELINAHDLISAHCVLYKLFINYLSY